MISKFLFISIKPEFATKLMSKEKTIELRKNRPNVKSGDFVLIYATMPIKSIIGFGKIEKILEFSPEYMWDNYSEKLGIDKIRYDEYYNNTNRAIGIEISSICKFKKAIELQDIRSFFPRFSPPQTYRYFSKFKALKTYYSLDKMH